MATAPFKHNFSPGVDHMQYGVLAERQGGTDETIGS